jgi:hypothetical protein
MTSSKESIMSYFAGMQKGNLDSVKSDAHGKIKKETVALQGVSGSGASRPLRRIPAIVSFPNPTLSLVGGNRSSCPIPDLWPTQPASKCGTAIPVSDSPTYDAKASKAVIA